MKKMYEIHVESTWKCMESTWNCMESMWKCMESMWKCMESMVGVYGIHVEFMEQNHSIWIPPGMWGHSKVLPFANVHITSFSTTS